VFFQLQKGDQVALVTPAAAADEKAIEIVSQLLYEAGLTPVSLWKLLSSNALCKFR
jgi:ethanolamine utilization protein EutP (predicted NTPase)